MLNDLSPKFEVLIQLCREKKGQLDVSSPHFEAACALLRKTVAHQVSVDLKTTLVAELCSCFDITEEELLQHTYGISSNGVNGFSRYHFGGYDPQKAEDELDALIPQHGYFRHYVDFTRNSEPPLSYHFFSSVVGVAATINRRVFLRWGLYNYYPATGIILIGPSGLKKTSAADVTVGILQDLSLIDVYAEKITPEALIESLKGENATGLIYAPEMAVFINRKKYNEGLIELITRWMDCPTTWKGNTIGRGKVTLNNVGISSILCSTPDWLMDNLPEGTFGGGFMARYLLVVQDVSPRIVVRPDPPDLSERERIKLELAYMHTFQGEATLSAETWAEHQKWYTQHKQESEHPDHELLGTYYQRKQGHVLRLALCLHLATHYDTDSPFEVCLDCHTRAVGILDWNERFLPNLFEQLFKTSAGIEQGELLKTIKAAGGAISHTALLRKLQHKYDATRIKSLCNSLKEAGQLREENGMLGHMYVLEVLK